MEIQKEAFTSLMEYYKVLPVETKRKEVIDSIEQIISNYTKICMKFGIVPNMMLSKEMLKLSSKEITEEEFLNAIFAYINVLDDVSAQFVEKMCDVIDNKNK